MGKQIKGAPPGFQTSTKGPGWQQFVLNSPAANEIVFAELGIDDIDAYAAKMTKRTGRPRVHLPPFVEADEPLWWADHWGRYGAPENERTWLGLTWDANKVHTAQILFDFSFAVAEYYTKRGQGGQWILFPEILHVCRRTGQVVIECGT